MGKDSYRNENADILKDINTEGEKMMGIEILVWLVMGAMMAFTWCFFLDADKQTLTVLTIIGAFLGPLSIILPVWVIFAAVQWDLVMMFQENRKAKRRK